jgi:anthranilate/para-aminobenzoate synthase component II
MFLKICSGVACIIFLAGCESSMFHEMYHGKKKDETRKKVTKTLAREKYSSEKNVEWMSNSEINSQEREILSNQHRQMDSSRDARRAKVFGGWSPFRKDE